MAQEVGPTEDDRRALLGIYSSSQLQIAGLTLALTVGVVGEIGLFFQPGVVGTWLQAPVFALIPSTVFLAVVLLKSYIVYGGAIRVTLDYDLPTAEELDQALEEASTLYRPPVAVDISNGLDALDAYYICKVRLRFQHDWLGRLAWAGLRYRLALSTTVFIVSLLLYSAVWYAYPILVH